MIKSELILRIAEQNPHLYQQDVEKIVNTVLDRIAQGLAAGDRVELRGFGAFSLRHRDERIGRNPKNGEPVKVEKKALVAFRAGREMQKRLNPKEPAGKLPETLQELRKAS